jgi:hypothetical protein
MLHYDYVMWEPGTSKIYCRPTTLCFYVPVLECCGRHIKATSSMRRQRRMGWIIQPTIRALIEELKTMSMISGYQMPDDATLGPYEDLLDFKLKLAKDKMADSETPLII